MREFFRVLRPGGWAILQSRFDHSLAVTLECGWLATPRERELTFGQHDHLRLYGADYRARLERAGFAVDVVDFGAALPRETVERSRLNACELIYRCRRER